MTQTARPGSTSADPGTPDAIRLQATVAELAADRYTGRRVGTAGSQAAATWLARQLTEMDATVATETFPVPGVRDLYATPTLRWHDLPLVHRRDFVEHLASADLPEPAPAPWPPLPPQARGYWPPRPRTRPAPRDCWCHAASTPRAGCRR